MTKAERIKDIVDKYRALLIGWENAMSILCRECGMTEVQASDALLSRVD